jgi:putative transposase
VSCYRLIEAEKATHTVPMLCRLLGVSPSGYYAWRRRPLSERARFDAVLSEKIEAIHRNSRATYGAPRVHAELRTIGIRCSRKRVARLMRRAKLRGCLRGRRMRTTHTVALRQAAPDLVGRNFASEEPDRLWVADITYVRSKEGFVYLAFILDACSRRVVGWSMATHLRSELVVEPCRWRSPGASPLASPLQGSCTTRTEECSTPLCPSARDLRMKDCYRRWVGRAAHTTTPSPSLSWLP